MNGKRFSENKARRNGFYLALAVCLVAVGIAAWSTFDAVQGYIAANGDPGSSTSSGASGSSQENPGSDDPEAPRSPAPKTPAPSTRPYTAVKPSESPSATSKPRPSAPTPAPSADPQDTQTGEETSGEEPQVPVNAPLYEISGEMIYPLSSKEVSKAYSAGAPVYSSTMKDWRVHAGMDLSAESGEQVLACGNGMVKETYTDNMLGNVMVVEHGEYLFYYCGLGENYLCSPGDVVSMGQAIGTVTAVPAESADQPHLHLEVRRDSSYLNPQAVLEGEE